MNYTGYLRLKATEHTDEQCERCTLSYDFQCSDGMVLEGLFNDTDAPINELITVEIEKNCVVTWDYLEDRHPVAMKSAERKDIALAWVLPHGKSKTKSDFQRVKRAARKLENFLKQTNDGKWTFIRVTPYVIENVPHNSMGLHFTWELVKDQMEEQWPGRFEEHNYTHGWGGGKPGLNGHAYINSSVAWTYAVGGIRTICHECGHCFGCHHSTTENNQYGDPTCIMAKAHAGFNAPQLVSLDQIEKVGDGDSGSTRFLVPAECSRVDLRNGEFRALRVGTFHLLSTRKVQEQSDLGVTNPDWSPRDDVIYIHKVGRFGISIPQYVGMIKPEESQQVEDLTITHAGAKEGVVRVQIGEPDMIEDFPKPLKPSPGDPITEEHSGLWANPEYQHQGVDLFVHDGDRVTGYWYTYHPRGKRGSALNGKTNGKEWFVMNGRIDPETNVVDLEILQTRDRDSKVVGHGTMRLVDGKILFRSYTENYGRDHWFLEMVTTPREEPSGLFKSGKNEGYSVGKFKDHKGRDIYAVYHYGYYGSDLEWTLYSGRDPQNLPGYRTSGKYKQTFENPVESVDPIDLDDVLELEPVL